MKWFLLHGLHEFFTLQIKKVFEEKKVNYGKARTLYQRTNDMVTKRKVI